MAQKKLQRFADIKAFPNVLEYPENIAGKWGSFFNNSYPLVLELACGKGEYTLGLAELHPQKNYIGVDVKGNRLWVGAKLALIEQIKNVAFLRTQIEKIDKYFAKNEVDEIWITFPDPQLRNSKAKKRLTHPRFLKLYQQILKNDGKIHLKTDSPSLYQFTKTIIDLYRLNLITDIPDLYNQEILTAELAIKTYYESLDIAKSRRIFYLCFSLPSNMPDKEQELVTILRAANESV